MRKTYVRDLQAFFQRVNLKPALALIPIIGPQMQLASKDGWRGLT